MLDIQSALKVDYSCSTYFQDLAVPMADCTRTTSFDHWNPISHACLPWERRCWALRWNGRLFISALWSVHAVRL